jgi:hypothetical protein
MSQVCAFDTQLDLLLSAASNSMAGHDPRDTTGQPSTTAVPVMAACQCRLTHVCAQYNHATVTMTAWQLAAHRSILGSLQAMHCAILWSGYDHIALVSPKATVCAGPQLVRGYNTPWPCTTQASTPTGGASSTGACISPHVDDKEKDETWVVINHKHQTASSRPLCCNKIHLASQPADEITNAD